MASSAATALTIAFVIFMIFWETRRTGASSPALWLPVIWLGIAASRFPSQWFAFGETDLTSNIADGSTPDAIFFLALIIAGGCVLVRRRVALSALIRQNWWLFAFFAFGFISILWSDFPYIAFKRWVKALGHPVMALVILTDPHPLRALQLVLKRCAYLLLPFSVLLIKYYPQIGRGFDTFTGEAVNIGVGLTKSDLGYLSMLTGIFFAWMLLQARKIVERTRRQQEIVLSVVFLAMALWLLIRSNSATSLVTFMLGTAIIVGTPLVNRRRVGLYLVLAVSVVLVSQALFDPYGAVISALGRDPTLNDRTKVWADVLSLQDRPLIGAGFESFWLGDRLAAMWAKWWWRPSQAHNGYIETYLNLGLVGVALLVAMIVSTFRKITTSLLDEIEFSRLRLALLCVIVVFNYTEASFKALHILWTMFCVIAITYQESTGRETTARRHAFRPMTPRYCPPRREM